MSRGFTIQDLDRLKAEGKIRGYKLAPEKIPEKAEKYSAKAGKNIPTGQKKKDWITLHLQAWCEANKVELRTELKFYPERKWRFDWAVPEMMLAVEYEGLSFKKTGHTTSEGYTANVEKYNAAAHLGWKVFRYTYRNYTNILADLEKVIK